MLLRNIFLIFLFLSVGTVGAQTTDHEPPPDSLIKVDVEPTPLNLDSIRRNITYPKVLQDAGVQGKVYVKILVGENGIPIKHIIKKSPHPLLTKEIEKNLYQLRFSPALLDSKPMKFWVNIPYDFKLISPRKYKKKLKEESL